MDKRVLSKSRKMTAFVMAWLLAVMMIFGGMQKKVVCADETVLSNSLNPDIDTVLTSVKTYILSKDTNPDFSSSWNLIGLSRSSMEVPQSYKDTYYSNVIAYLKENSWNITKNKYSEYSKLILAMTSIGKNAQNIEGHNLLSFLSDFSNVKKQGINGPIWALIALKSNPEYSIPIDSSVSEQTTEEGLISYILGKETASGGWTLIGSVPDSDVTGMAIQALAPYYNKRSDVTGAIDRALTWLSNSQEQSTGGFTTMGTETSESIAQIIVALSSLFVDCSKDTRFVKNKEWPVKALFGFYMPEGGFMHVKSGSNSNGGGTAGVINGMATEQGLYATVAYKRLLEGKTALYDMSDIQIPGQGTTQKPEEGTTSIQKPDDSQDNGSQGNDGGANQNGNTSNTENTSNGKIKVIKISLDYSTIYLNIGSSKTLKASVTPSNAYNRKIKWTTSDKKVAKVSTKGKVTGIGEGTAQITASSVDGSKIKVVCTVKVTKKSNSAEATTAAPKPLATTKKVNLTGTGNVSGSVKTTKTAEKSTSQEETTTEMGGWNFNGADYVSEASAEEEVIMEEELPEERRIHIPYADEIICMEIGAAICGLVWAVWWFGYKKKRVISIKDRSN